MKVLLNFFVFLFHSNTDWAVQDLPLAMRNRNLREKASNSLVVFYSAIHGRGLFTRRDIAEDEIIIEYAGEVNKTYFYLVILINRSSL